MLPPASRRPLLIAFAAGVGSAFAFEPAGLWPLMLVAVAILCELVLHAPSLRRALAVGWLFGLGQFVVGLNWIATAFTFQAAMPAWLGWVAVVLVSLFLALYPMLSAGLAWRFGRQRSLALVLTLAGAWAITEWLRATIFTGFPWNPIGVVLVDTPLLNLSTHIGTYGLSALTAAIGGGLWLLFRQQWWGAFGIASGVALLLTLPRPAIPEQCCLMTVDAEGPRPSATTAQEAPPPPGTPPPPPPGYINQPQQPPVQEPAPPAPRADLPPPDPDAPLTSTQVRASRSFYDIRVVQPNIGQEDKWRPGFSDVAASRLAELSSLPGNAFPRLLFWPEAAVTDPLLDERQGPYANMAEFERIRAASVVRPGEYLLTGGIALFSSDGVSVAGASNSVFVLGSDGQILFRYDKAHLVPYGEYLPMRPLLSALGLSRLAPGDVDFVAGPGPRTVSLPGWGKVGFQICYEIIFSGEVASRSDRPDFIFNPSNDAWFGAWGPPQHLAQARLRAAEEALPVIRSTPTGISAMIDARGDLVDTIGWREAGVIDAQLPLASIEPTPFGRFGNLIPLLLGFALLIAGIALDARGRYRRET